MSLNESYIIEGVGNEVLLSGVFFAVLLAFISYLYFKFIGNYMVERFIRPVPEVSRPITLMSNRLSGSSEANGTSVTQHYGSDHQCPVCLNEPQYPVETNCGHLFCAQCIITYWRHGSWLGPVRCPVCRQTVTVLLQCFRDNPSISDTERRQLLDGINDYNRHFSGEPRPWLDYLWDLPTLLRHAGSEFFSVGGIMYMFRLRIILCFVAAFMYLISPLDMIPEAVFGILGLLDDMFVVLLLAIYVTVIYRRFLATRWENQ